LAWTACPIVFVAQMIRPETAATSSACSSKSCAASEFLLDLVKEPAVELDPSSSGLTTQQ